jgi:hypothetical protein
MTINSETRVAGPFDGNDSTVSFPFTFKVFDSDEVRVVAETGAVETDLELGTDYTVTLNADQNASPGGSVVLAAPLATGTRLTLTSALEMLQPVDLTNQGGFYPRVINSALDRLTILLQQLASVVSRTLKFPLSDGPVGDLPGRAVRAGTVLAFDEATGEPVAGPDIASVNGVAGALVAVNTVANNIADVNTVAGNIADVNVVGQNIADVNTVADNIADLSNFSGVYYGPSATDPTTRRDGSPLQVGDLYFNTVTNALRTYNGSAWRQSVSGAVTVQNLSGDGVETEFLLDYAPDSEAVTDVFVNGVYQQKNTYALGGANGDVLIFDEAPPVGAGNIEVVVSSLIPSDDKLRQDLANGTSYLVDANVVGKADIHLDSVASITGLIGRYAGDTLQTSSYHPGWAATLAGPVGGATFVWDATRPKSQHNGGNIISPTVPWDGAEANLAAYIAKTGETDAAGSGCWVHKNLRGNEYNVLQWGAKNDATTNGANDAMIQPLLDYIEASVGGGYGGIVNFPRGNYRFSIYFNVRDRTTLRGEGTSATILQFLGTSVGNCITLGPTGPNHPLNPNGHWVFGVRLENLAVSGGNAYKGLDRALIYTDGAHEHSGLFNVVLRDFVNFGVHYATGNGGPALFEVSDVEIYGSDTAPTSGTKRGISCNAGGALILVRHATITGGGTHKLAQGIAMLKDNLIAQGVHFENTSVGISLSQTDAASPRVNVLAGVTGNSTVGTSGLVDIASGFEGSVSAHGLINKSLSTTGLITLINRKTGESFTDQALAAYMYPSAVSQGESVSHGRINVASGVASIVKQQGRAFTVSQTAAGVTQITLSSAMPDTNYTVTPAARLSGGGACFVEFSPISTTVFEIRVRNSAGALADPASVWFSLES